MLTECEDGLPDVSDKPEDAESGDDDEVVAVERAIVLAEA